MSTALKNRLVGSIVFIAVGVIVLPELLDGHKKEAAESFVEVPQRPSFEHNIEPKSQPDDFEQKVVYLQPTEDAVAMDEQVSLDDAQDNSEVTEANTDATNVKNASEQTTDEAAAQVMTPELPKEMKPIEVPIQEQVQEDATAWVVQLGSFSNKKNVEALLKKLRSAGYTSFSRPIKTKSGKELTKVFVGPDVDRKRLEGIQDHLKEITKLSGQITKFKPAR